ncbi:hypothetical protein C8Q73DRAFT_796360 [Cubamyces lactineus]|nr:hypothetical protein C8Q73DRAFT_796360 [Cubamyces lactineus]
MTDALQLRLDRVSTSMQQYDKAATDLRLRQTRTPAESQKSQRVADIKSKQAALRDLRNVEVVYVEVYGFYAKRAGDPGRAISKTCRRLTMKATDSADIVFDRALSAVREIYTAQPVASRKELPITEGDFKREQAVYSIAKGHRGTATGYHIDVQAASLKSIGDVFKGLQADGTLSQTDAKERLIRLNVSIYVAPNADESAEEIVDLATLSIAPTRRANGIKSSTRVSRSSVRPSSGSSGKRKRDTAVDREGNTSKKLASARPTYVSAFRPPPLPINRPPAYTAFKVRRVLCVADNTGVPSVVESSAEEDVLVGQGWQKFKGKSEPCEGWLGGGGSKYAFMGMYNGDPYALLQMAPLGSYAADDEGNARYLLDELKLLAIAQYFATTFHQRAEAYNVDLADVANIRFNHDGAFLGRLVNQWDLGFVPSPNEVDERLLIYDTFLATRLIRKADGYVEMKFSGAHETGKNTTPIGRVVDAFAHHVLVDSNYTCVLVDLQGFVRGKEVILFDPQAHTTDWATGPTGYWDKGKVEIDKFREEHKCNELCRRLGLVQAEKMPAVRTGPKTPPVARRTRGVQKSNPMAVRNLIAGISDDESLASDDDKDIEVDELLSSSPSSHVK